MDWRIQVLAADGSAKPTIAGDDQVAGIDSMQLDPAGSCGEATLTAIAGAIDLEPRDVITVQYSLDGFTTVKGNLYRGYITSAGTTRGSRLQRYRAMGLKQRAYEIPLTQRRIAGGDVAVMAKALFDGPLEPAFVVGADNLLGALPALGFQLGDRHPRLQTAGDALDDLADTVGAFTVPPGETHTYGGRTFFAGELVPAVRWGATATGRWFFHRPLGQTSLNENGRRVEVGWSARDAEEVADRITLVYASAYNGDPQVVNFPAGDSVPSPVAQPLSYTAGTGTLRAGLVQTLEAPLDFMADGITSTDHAGPNVINGANAFDGNPATYAEFDQDGPGNPPGFITATAQGATGAIVLIDIEFSASRFYTPIAGWLPPNARIYLNVRTSGGTLITTLAYEFDPDPGVRRLFALPAMVEVTADPTLTPGRVDAVVSGAQAVRLYELELWTIDQPTADRLGQAFTRAPAAEVAEVRYRGLAPVTGLGGTPAASVATLRLTTAEGDELVLPIERYDAVITPDEGAVVTIHAGQAFNAEQQAERTVLERLARAAIAKGGARR